MTKRDMLSLETLNGQRKASSWLTLGPFPTYTMHPFIGPSRVSDLNICQTSEPQWSTNLCHIKVSGSTEHSNWGYGSSYNSSGIPSTSFFTCTIITVATTCIPVSPYCTFTCTFESLQSLIALNCRHWTTYELKNVEKGKISMHSSKQTQLWMIS